MSVSTYLTRKLLSFTFLSLVLGGPVLGVVAALVLVAHGFTAQLPEGRFPAILVFFTHFIPILSGLLVCGACWAIAYKIFPKIENYV